MCFYFILQVYNEHTDNIGHDFGPETEERKQAVRDLDKTIVYMLDQIDGMGMRDEGNETIEAIITGMVIIILLDNSNLVTIVDI